MTKAKRKPARLSLVKPSPLSDEERERLDALHDELRPFEKAWLDWLVASAAIQANVVVGRDIRTSNSEAEDHAVWKLIKLRATRIHMLLRKVRVLQDMMKGGSGWHDGRDHMMIASIAVDLGKWPVNLP